MRTPFAWLLAVLLLLLPCSAVQAGQARSVQGKAVQRTLEQAEQLAGDPSSQAGDSVESPAQARQPVAEVEEAPDWQQDALDAGEVPDGPERVLSFDSTIQIQQDGSIEVTEDIRVLVKGIDIQRGIIREIPTIYQTGGRKVLVPIDRIKVEHNGEQVVFMKYALDNGIGLRIGSPYVYLENGVHQYSISYRVLRQIGRFDSWDELYWNVNGNAWEFDFDSISCTVVLPEDVPDVELRTEAYTGAFGSRGRDYAVEQLDARSVRFSTTRTLSTYEGLTVVVGFPKGIVADVPASQKFAWWMESNGGWAVALLLTLIVFLYFWISWLRVGRDPSEGLVMREERPLIGLNAAKLRWIWKLDIDDTLMSALILELAEKGALVISRGKGGSWKLKDGKRDRRMLEPEEKAFLDTLFRYGTESFSLDSDHSSTVRAARDAVEQSLSRQLHHVYYEMNPRQRGTGLVLACSAFIVWLMCLSTGLFFFDSADFFLFLLALVAISGTFYILMPAYNALGRAVLDRIHGFRLAMRGGEDSLGEYQYADEVLQQKYLPYAVALGVNLEWVLKLRKVSAAAGRSLSRPDWYAGRKDDYVYRNQFDYTSFGNVMPRSLARRYRSASHPPPPPPSSSSSSGGGWGGGSTSSGSWGSSSGSGFSSSSSSSSGGGYSGGGGGGGGGKGW